MSNPVAVSFDCLHYEPTGLTGLSRRRVEGKIDFMLEGDSVIVTMPPPIGHRFEITTHPKKFHALIRDLCGGGQGTLAWDVRVEFLSHVAAVLCAGKIRDVLPPGCDVDVVPVVVPYEPPTPPERTR